MYEPNVVADNLQIILNNLYGKRAQPESDLARIMDAAWAEMEADKPALLERRSVPFTGTLEGQPVSSDADSIFACFGEGDEAAWVVFLWFEGGWAVARRPLTDDTDTMPWLDHYVKKEFIGIAR